MISKSAPREMSEAIGQHLAVHQFPLKFRHVVIDRSHNDVYAHPELGRISQSEPASGELDGVRDEEMTHLVRGPTSSQGRFKEAAMKLPTLAMFFACATASVAAEPPGTAAAAQQVPYAFIAFKPDISDYYPAASRALGEQGTVSLVLCYDRDGKPHEVTVVNSSGIARIDAAAVRWGKAARIKPAIRNGASKPDCVWVPAKFSLERPQEPSDQGEGSLPLPAFIWPSPPPPPPPGRFIPLGGEVR